MSIANLMVSNSYDLYGRSLNVKDLISEAFQTTDISATTGTIATLGSTTATLGTAISNNFKQANGFNVLSPWSATKAYIVGDQVLSSGFLWKCLVANTNVQPSTVDPSQAQWAQLSSNNSVLNESAYVVINKVVGDDSKALVSAVPFKSVGAALLYLKGIGGGVAKIMSVNQTYTWGNANDAYNGIVLDGGDETDDITVNPTNTLEAYAVFTNTNGLTVKNCTWQRPGGTGGEVFNTQGCENVTLQNIKFVDPTGAGGICQITVYGTVPAPFGSHSFINCWQNVIDSTSMGLIISGQAKAGTVILIDNAGLTSKSSWTINNVSGGGITGGSNLTFICRNSYINSGNFTHTEGSTMIFTNCIFAGGTNFVSLATTGSLVLNNCSFFDPLTNTWCGVNINMTGTANLLMVDCLTNPNSTTDVISFTTLTSAVVSSGPAARFNRIAAMATTPQALQALVTGTATQLQFPTITTNPFNTITQVGAAAGTFKFSVLGTFNVFVQLDVSNSSTNGEQTSHNAWLGVSGATEGTAVGVSQWTRPITSAGNLATYPTSRIQLIFSVTVTSSPLLNTDIYFYARALGSVNSTARILSCSTVQVR